MATKVSRRAIARVVVDKLVDGQSDSSTVMRELAALLIDRKMTESADMIINDIADELYTRTGLLTVEVTSAHALTKEDRRDLITYLKDMTKSASVSLHEQVDENLIGGLIAKTPSAELDVSVRKTLRQLTGIA